jgi:hypothetical protein
MRTARTDTWLAALASRGWKAPPLVRTRHISAPVPDNRATRWLYRRASAHVVTTGEALREQLIRHNGLLPANVTSVPTGIDPAGFREPTRAQRQSRRRELGLPAGAAIVGIVATLRAGRAIGSCWKRSHRCATSGARRNRRRRPAAHGTRRAGEVAPPRDRVTFAGNRDDVAPGCRASTCSRCRRTRTKAFRRRCCRRCSPGSAA